MEDRLAKARISRQTRERAPGAGRKRKLATPEDRLLFILMYFRCYPTQDLQGLLFDMSQPAAFNWIHKLTKILESTLGRKMELPLRPAACTIQELFQRCPRLGYIIDGAERPIQRPKCPERQAKCYSGKKKRHSIKKTVVSSAKTKKVVFLGKTRPGSVHDKKMADLDKVPFPRDSVLLKDTGYQGYEPPGITCLQPKKKPRKRELTALDKTVNRGISSIRVRVEHSIGGVKRSRIISSVYRNRKLGFDDRSMAVGCGLYNFTVSCRTLTAE